MLKVMGLVPIFYFFVSFYHYCQDHLYPSLGKRKPSPGFTLFGRHFDPYKAMLERIR
jgi:hypothetical protein